MEPDFPRPHFPLWSLSTFAPAIVCLFERHVPASRVSFALFELEAWLSMEIRRNLSAESIKPDYVRWECFLPCDLWLSRSRDGSRLPLEILLKFTTLSNCFVGADAPFDTFLQRCIHQKYFTPRSPYSKDIYFR